MEEEKKKIKIIKIIIIIKKQDETGHFSNGIQCAAMACDTNTRVSFCLCCMFPKLHYQTVF